jgi:hypothetical protein
MAYHAWAADHAAGRDAILLAPTNELAPTSTHAPASTGSPTAPQPQRPSPSATD